MHLSLRCHIFYGEENHAWTITILLNPVGIEEHLLKADSRKIVLDLKVIYRVVIGYDLLQQFPKPLDIPLAIPRS